MTKKLVEITWWALDVLLAYVASAALSGLVAWAVDAWDFWTPFGIVLPTALILCWGAAQRRGEQLAAEVRRCRHESMRLLVEVVAARAVATVARLGGDR